MRLKHYLESNQISQKDFAKAIGVTPLTIWRYLQNHRKPNCLVLSKIEKVTNGAVKPTDFEQPELSSLSA